MPRRSSPPGPCDGSLEDLAHTLLSVYKKLGDKETRAAIRLGHAKTMVSAAARRTLLALDELEREDSNLHPDDIMLTLEEALNDKEVIWS